MKKKQLKIQNIHNTHTYVGVSEGKKCQFFGKFWVRTKWTIPKVEKQSKIKSRKSKYGKKRMQQVTKQKN